MSFYAVRRGRTVGVFTDWSTTEASVKGFPGAEHKKFKTLSDAQGYLGVVQTPIAQALVTQAPIAYCDGSFADGKIGFGVVLNGEEFYGRVPFPGTPTNSVAEWYALFYTLTMAKTRGIHGLTVYTDSQYCVRSVNEWYHGWKNRNWRKADGEPVMYPEMIEAVVTLKNEIGATVAWIKGHNGDPGNERADRLADLGRLM